ncbi:GntR family transcriptional regulator [Arsenicicoccus dermatophilus]|uniref:GntR family transcriptional regulator n=1 Tax=Arsenicicoccus dermatophilus TaxID=1076331 RepID=UPI001F4CEC1B|nr:GntR family transcriptional regulator [Arsenicicoccus dermatophilus]MCH8611897.1 GntR family transcriptional regulator [Arsenicicoccus dermatophilus]
MTSPTPAEPASRRLARALREDIAHGDLAPGDKLPSERTLAETHGVARNTAREAVRILADEGLVTAEHGRGVFVRPKPPLMRFGQRRYARTLRESTGKSPFRAEVEAQGRIPRVDCTSITRITPIPEVAERLDINPETETVVRRENWYYADDEPIQVGVTYSPWSIVEGTPIADSAQMGKGSLYARFEEKGHPITTIREEISSRMPTPDEVAGLRIPDGVPVIDLTHTGYDDQDRPFEVTTFVMRADRSALDYRMPVED